MFGKFGRLSAVMVVVVMCSASTRAQVLDQVPSDAVVVVKIRNLQDASQKVAALAQQWGLAMMVPGMQDPLGTLLLGTRMTEGVNRNAEAAIVIMPTKTDGRAEPLILVPVTDYAAFVKNFVDGKTEGEITTFTMPRFGAPANTRPVGQRSYVAQWGNYAAVSSKRTILMTKPLGIKVAGLTAGEMQNKDIIAFVNIPAIRDRALPELTKARQEAMTEMDRKLAGGVAQPESPAPADNLAKLAPVARAAVNQLFNVAEGYLKQANAVTLGINLSADGIHTTLMTEFASGTYGGELVAGVKSADMPLISGLPDQKYFLIGGGVPDSATFSRIIDDFMSPILPALAAAGQDGKPLLDYVTLIKQTVAAAKGQSFGLVAPAGQLGQESLMQMVSVNRGDAKVLLESTIKSMTLQNDFMKMFNAHAADQVRIIRTPAGKMVDGVAFDVIQTRFNFGDNPQAAQADQMFKTIYGPDGLTYHMAALDAGTLLVIAGGNDALISSTIAAARAGGDPTAKLQGYAAVSAQLPKHRMVLMFIPLDNMVTTGVNIAGQFGMPVPVQFPPDLPPIGVTLGTEGNAVRMDSYIPSQLVQSLIAAGMQAFMQMQGGPQGAPGGAL